MPLAIGARNADGTERDLTGETIEFRAAPDFQWLTPTVYKTDGDGIEIIDAEGGVFEVMFSRDDFIAGATLVWDVRDHRHGRQRFNDGFCRRGRKQAGQIRLAGDRSAAVAGGLSRCGARRAGAHRRRAGARSQPSLALSPSSHLQPGFKRTPASARGPPQSQPQALPTQGLAHRQRAAAWASWSKARASSQPLQRQSAGPRAAERRPRPSKRRSWPRRPSHDH